MQIILILLLLGICQGWSKPPGPVALEVFGSLTEWRAKGDLPSGVFLSPFASVESRERGAAIWKMRAEKIRQEDLELSVLAERTDGELGGVLLLGRIADSGESSVFSVGMVRREGDWKLAPFAGSFDNAGLGFGSDLLKRARVLEKWMAERNRDSLELIAREDAKRFRDSLLGALSTEKREESSDREAIEYFLEAAEAGRTNELLVWQGFLYPEGIDDLDWDERLAITRRGMQGEDVRETWRLLTSPGVLKVVSPEPISPKQSGTYLVFFLSPFLSEPEDRKIQTVRFTIEGEGKERRIKLPAIFAQADDEARGLEQAHAEESRYSDAREAIHAVPFFKQANPQSLEPTPERAVAELLASLEAAELERFLRLLRRDSYELEEDEKPDYNWLIDLGFQGNQKGPVGEAGYTHYLLREYRKYQAAIRWWNEVLVLREESALQPLKFYREDGAALVVLVTGSESDSWQATFKTLWLQEVEGSWVVLAGSERPLAESLSPAMVEATGALFERYKGEQDQLLEAHYEALWDRVGLAELQAEAPSKEQAEEVAQLWRESLQRNVVTEVFSHSAMIAAPKKMKNLMNDLKFLASGASRAGVADEILGTKKGGPFHAISMKTGNGAGLDLTFPLLLAVSTQKGVRILLDAELVLPTNLAKKLRNEERLRILKKQLPEKHFGELQELLGWHEKLAEIPWQAWEAQRLEQEIAK